MLNRRALVLKKLFGGGGGKDMHIRMSGECLKTKLLNKVKRWTKSLLILKILAEGQFDGLEQKAIVLK